MTKKKNFVLDARTELGLTQEEMAAELGMTQGNLSWYETGRTSKIPKLMREKIEAMLEVHRLAPQSK